MLFKNVPDNLHDLALKELLPRVSYLRKRFKGADTVLKENGFHVNSSPPGGPYGPPGGALIGIPPGMGGGPPGAAPSGPYAAFSGGAGAPPPFPMMGEHQPPKRGSGRGAGAHKPGPASAMAVSDKVYGRNGQPDKMIKRLEVGVDKIGLLIGRGGSKVKEIQESTGKIFYNKAAKRRGTNARRRTPTDY